MKHYRIYDQDNQIEIGTLLYYEGDRAFIIELREELDEWTAPLMFAGMVERGINTVPRELGILWVRERIIPPDRQNIASILANHHLKEYDEMKFLELSGGRCSQDGMVIERQEQLPDYVLQRQRKNLVDVVPCDENELLCFFVDETVRKVSLGSLQGGQPGEVSRSPMQGGKRDEEFPGSLHANLRHVMQNRKLFESCRVGSGGYYATFNASIDLPASLLYRSGKKLPLSLKDFYAFAKRNLPDTTESCALLGCTRQNLAYMVKQGRITPVREEVKGNLYLKGNLLRSRD